MSAIPISSVMEEGCVPIKTRQDLIEARRKFFSHILSVFNSMSNESAAQAMNEWGMKTPKQPANEDVFQLPQRGWFIIRETTDRPFSLSVWQSGKWIRMGVTVFPSQAANSANLNQAMDDVFYGDKPHFAVRGNMFMFDWHFETPDFFTSLSEQETWVLAIHHLYHMTDDILARQL